MASKDYSALPPLVQSGEYSDFELVCEGQSFKLHRAIVCPKSPVIAKALSGEFQVGNPAIRHLDLGELMRILGGRIQGPTRRRVWCYRRSTDDILLVHQGLPGCPAHKQPRASSDQVIDPSSVLLQPEGENAADVLLAHLRINAVADYYDIQKLVGLANAKIQPLLANGPPTEFFRLFIQEVSNFTGDPALRSMVASAAANRIEELTESPDFLHMKLDEKLAMEIISACSSRVRELQSQLREIQLLHTDESSRSNRIIDNIDNCVQKLKGTSECRNCDARFGCYIEKHGKEQEPSYTLRCGACRCRHRPA